jgi:diguanylate cyclase
MLAEIVRRRAVARCAVAALSLGLFALAALAMWSTVSTTRTTAWVRDADRVSERWSQVSTLLSQEHEHLVDSRRAGGDVGRARLAASLGSAGSSLAWLEVNGDPVDRSRAVLTHDPYRTSMTA